jgi:hypothetical protein
MKLFSKSPSEKELLATIAQNQVLLSKKLENIEKRLDKMDKRQTEGFAETIKGLFILYGKAVMARLNFIELSEGKPISASANEWREIKNSQSPRPNPNILILPIDGQVGEENEAFKKTRKSKLN